MYFFKLEMALHLTLKNSKHFKIIPFSYKFKKQIINTLLLYLVQ